MRPAAREAIETVALAVLVFLLFQATVSNFEVQGNSMVPNLQDRERVLVNKLTYMAIKPNSLNQYLPWMGEDRGEPWFLFHPPERGEIIVFRFPGDITQNFVKRVIGLPGEVVELRDTEIYVNGQLLDEPYERIEIHEPDNRPVVVGDGMYYVLGDNRLQSEDSRSERVGLIPEENIIGKVWMEYWPLDRIGVLTFPFGWANAFPLAR
jgi:signal peptidase I